MIWLDENAINALEYNLSDAENRIDEKVDDIEDNEENIDASIGYGSNKIVKAKKATINPSSIINVIKEGNRKMEQINLLYVSFSNSKRIDRKNRLLVKIYTMI